MLEDGTVDLPSVVALNLLKGKRKKKAEFKKVTLRRVGVKPASEPILPLVALALEDNVLSNVSSLDALLAIPPSVIGRGHRKRMLLPMNAAKRETCISRKVVKRGDEWVVDPVLAQPYDSALWFLKKVGKHIGCVDPVSFFTFQRLAVDTMNSVDVTESDRLAAAGHNSGSRVQERAYQSRNTRLDLPSMIQGTERLSDAAIAVRGLSWEEDAPTSISILGMREIVAELQHIKDKIISAHGTITEATKQGSPLVDDYNRVYRQRRAHREPLMRAKLKEEVAAYIESKTTAILKDAMENAPDYSDADADADADADSQAQAASFEAFMERAATAEEKREEVPGHQDDEELLDAHIVNAAVKALHAAAGGIRPSWPCRPISSFWPARPMAR